MCQTLSFRYARLPDLENIVAMLAQDPLGQGREVLQLPLDPNYLKAFESIDSDPNNELWVGVDAKNIAVAVFQLTFLPSLTYTGGWRAQIEGVRVHQRLRGKGVGRLLIEKAIARAREKNCCLVQLTTDKKRPEALGFYKALGFQASHEGMKLRF